MNKPKLYEETNHLQIQGCKEVLDEYFHLIKLKNDMNVIDIGCGPGNITFNVLRSKLSDTFKKLVGVDISDDMVKYAVENYSKEKCEFHKVNIESSEVDECFIEEFDLAFSFYCLHWIQNQRQGMLNINKLLKNGAALFSIIPTRHPFYDVYEKFLHIQKWQPYLHEWQKYTYQYQHMKNPRDTIKLYLEEAGFKVELCEFKTVSFSYGTANTIKKFIEAVNPFVKKIPKDLIDEYLEDFIKELFCLNTNALNSEIITLTHDIVVVYAIKI